MPRGEEARMLRLLRQDRIAEVRADLVRALPDARTDRRDDRGRAGAEPDHGGNGRLDHTGRRAAPAGMGGADHASLGIGQQDGRAVGGDDAESDIGPDGHHRVGARAAAGGPRCRHLDNIRAVHLHEADEAIRVGADRAGGAGAVLQHRIACVTSRQAAVEAGVGSAGHAALTREEAMRHAERVGGERHGRLLTARRGVVQGVRFRTRVASEGRDCTRPTP